MRVRYANPSTPPRSVRPGQLLTIKSVARPRPRPASSSSRPVIEIRSLAKNPSKRKKRKKTTRARARSTKESTMKRKKKKHHGKKRRTAAQKRATARMLAANRSRRHGGGTKRHKKHAHHASPTRKRRRTRAKKRGQFVTKSYRGKAKRSLIRAHYARRKNPSLPGYAQILLGVVAGVGLPVAGTAIARLVAPRHAPLISDLAAVGGVAVGVAMRKKSPIFAASIAAGSAAAAIAPTLSAQVEKLLAPKGSQQETVAAVRLQGLRQLQGLGALHAPRPVFGDGMGAVVAPGLGQVVSNYG